MGEKITDDGDLLARLVREAGDPNMEPGPGFVDSLRKTIMERLGPETFVEEDVVSITVQQGNRTMKRTIRLAVAATILVACGAVILWGLFGGSTSIAFADVAKVLDSLRSATFDVFTEVTGENGKESAVATGKGYFLAPSRQRIEITVDIGTEPAIKAAAAAAEKLHPGDKQEVEDATRTMADAMAKLPQIRMTHVSIVDSQAAKAVMLVPNVKIAIVMDMKKIYENMKKSAGGPPPDLFELARRIVREGCSGTGEEVKRLEKKEMEGQEAVGFWIHNALNGMGDMTLWADPRTAQPLRIELAGELFGKIHMVMSNFNYDVSLDPALFSLEPPADYVTQTVEVETPTEQDLLLTLSTVVDHNQGLFPQELAMSTEIMEAVMTEHRVPMPAMDQSVQDKMNAAMEKVAAKYGGREKLHEKYGDKLPPEIMAELMKATMPLAMEQPQNQMRTQMQEQMRAAKKLQGIAFFKSLKPENDPHYTGKGVKLNTPDRPICWYKPTGADNYRVIYADLSVQEMTPEEVGGFSKNSP